MADKLSITVKAVMARLFRARKHLEEASGVPLEGLVGRLKEGFGGVVRQKSGRPRKNPAFLIYFETVEDLQDLVDAGVLDAEAFADACGALREYR